MGGWGAQPPRPARMAQTEHLPIYKQTYDLCLHLEQVVRGFSRYHKYTLGAELRDGARRVLKLTPSACCWMAAALTSTRSTMPIVSPSVAGGRGGAPAPAATPPPAAGP